MTDQTFEILMDGDLIGLWEMEFTDGETRMLDIVRTIRSSTGEPIYLICKDATTYPWRQVISLKLMMYDAVSPPSHPIIRGETEPIVGGAGTPHRGFGLRRKQNNDETEPPPKGALPISKTRWG